MLAWPSAAASTACACAGLLSGLQKEKVSSWFMHVKEQQKQGQQVRQGTCVHDERVVNGSLSVLQLPNVPPPLPYLVWTGDKHIGVL